MAYKKAGEEVWNDDRTQGYRLTRDVNMGDIVHASDFSPLGDAPVLREHEAMEPWVSDFVFGTSVVDCIGE